jgi:hypothetical protein
MSSGCRWEGEGHTRDRRRPRRSVGSSLGHPYRRTISPSESTYRWWTEAATATADPSETRVGPRLKERRAWATMRRPSTFAWRAFPGRRRQRGRSGPGELQQVHQDLDLHPDTNVELGIEEILERHVLPLLHPVQLPFPPLVLVERVLRVLGALGLLLVAEYVPDVRLLRLELLAVLIQR